MSALKNTALKIVTAYAEPFTLKQVLLIEEKAKNVEPVDSKLAELCRQLANAVRELHNYSTSRLEKSRG